MTALRDDVGWGIPPVISHSGFAGRCGALSGRMACLLAVALLVCVSVAQGQAIEEGGFPVKGGGVSGESFSLFCPARLVVEAGESVLLSCSATDVPEEGVRYDWVSISGDGFYLLSASDELSPLFTAPLSGAGEEYAYRLTAMAAGEYRTASLTVSVEGVPGETIGAPVVREECDPFTVPEGLGAGCVEDKGPAPFGFGSVAEFPFPEAPGLPDRPSGPDRSGGSVMQAPPRLECPVAIFLEELETGSIECRAWDASGEEHLDYSWEPVGGTTRDYLENPRLIPEDSPTPSVVAPEAPAYETLESFRSVETTFRYRYRLTAMSRATGLSSFSEVEVFVSSSRPSVYCPLEVAVEEGATIALDCEGVDPLSSRMDYDEDGASIEWKWEGLWGTSTSLLDATDRSSPLFTAPAGSAGEAYHYIASMTSQASGVSRTARRRVTVRVEREEQAMVDASALSRKGGARVITCEDSEIYEATADFPLDCTVEYEPSGATYSWTGPDIENRLTGTDSLTPTFSPPDNVYWDTEYEYNVTMTVAGSDTASAVVVVTVLEKPDIRSCIRHRAYSVEEGAADLVFIGCLDPPQGAPGDDPVYRYMWVNSGITPSSALSLLSRTDISNPVFGVPDDVQQDTIYEYSLIISADNADEYTTQYTVTVLDLDRGAFNLACASSTFWVYQGSEDIELECEAPGAPEGATWEWTARGTTTDTDRLSATDIPNPVFDVHDYSVPIGTEGLYFYYTVSVSAGSQREEEDLVVRVIRNSIFIITCEAQAFFFEGDNDRTIGNCFVTRANDRTTPVSFEWEWLSRGTTADTDRLSATDIPNPVFDVPDSIDKHETYEYTLQITWDTSRGSGRGSYFVSVTVLDRDAFDGALALVCMDPGPVYEGSEDITLDCTASGAPDGAEYSYVWEPRGDTPHTARLIAGTDGPTPTFAVPRDVERDRAYTYRVTVTAGNSIPASANVTVTVLNRGTLAVACTDPDPVYEGSEDITLDCTASGAPEGSGYSYAWTSRGATSDTARLIAGTDGPTPTFSVPSEVSGDATYEYLLTVSVENAEDATAEVTVTVLNRGTLAVACTDPGPVYEGSEDITLDCAASGAPEGSAYAYAWTARGSTANTDLLVTGADGPTPTFAVPSEVSGDATYEYLLTVSVENAESASANVTVTVLNRGTLAVACTDPGPVYEGSEDITLDCAASGAPEGSAYAYAWTARGSTANTDLLVTGADGPTPTFAVPSEVSGDATYEYLLTVSVENAESASANVTVTVLNRGSLVVACTDPDPVYEGSEDITLDCSPSGAPEGSVYAYAWRARGSTATTDLLTDKTLLTPAFLVPDDLDETTTYEYLLTASAENAGSATAEVTVTVLNRGTLAVACTDPDPVYEGSEDIRLDCSPSGAPEGSVYAYAWRARGSTATTDLLTDKTLLTPAFLVPDDLDETTTYEYLLTASAENAGSATAEVTVTVLNRGSLAVACTDPDPVYEGSEDITLDCSASGAPEGSDYAYAWTARGATSDTARLIAGTDGPTPTFAVPSEVFGDATYEYLLTASAENAEDATAEVTVTVLNRGSLAVACTDPDPVYEGSEDITLDCSASGAPEGSVYAYAWTARGSTANTDLLVTGADGPTPTFAVPSEVSGDATYEYLLTVSVENAESASANVTVTVLNRGTLAVACTDPGPVYEGSEDITLDCTASGAPEGSVYAYAWTARGSTATTDLLTDKTLLTPAFLVPDDLDETTTYEYLLTASAENAEDATAEVTVTVLNRGSLAVACTDPDPVYEGSEDITLDCSASGAPEGSVYAYAWTARGSTANTDLLTDKTLLTPAFLVPDDLDETTTYEYLLTASAENAEDATAEVSVTVLDRVEGPPSDPVSRPLASSSAPEPAEPSALGVTVSASPLRFGVQLAETEVSLDPMTDRISTQVSGPYHAGRMTLSPGSGEALDENGEMALSIELASPVTLRHEGVEGASIVLSPSWSYAESCEQLSSQAIGSLYTEVTLTEGACRLLHFGGELNLVDVPSGYYAGSLDLVLRSGQKEETHSVQLDVMVVPAQRVITIGPGGVRFSTSREFAAGLTEEQNLSIYPDVAFLTGEKPHGVFELSNPSLVPLEVSVSARYGYTEATEDGREVVVEDTQGSRLGDLSSLVDIHPSVLVLMPGEKGFVRYGGQAEAFASMGEKGYAAFFDVVSEPRQYVRSDRMPEAVTGERTARVTMRVPGVYVPGEGASQLRATLLSLSSFPGSMSATFLLETADLPFAGEVLAYDGEGRELGRRETLVYTRSRVRIPLDRMPEEGTVFLRFSPRGGLQAPEPVSVPWDAPRRDIGAVQNEYQALPSAENSPTANAR